MKNFKAEFQQQLNAMNHLVNVELERRAEEAIRTIKGEDFVIVLTKIKCERDALRAACLKLEGQVKELTEYNDELTASLSSKGYSVIGKELGSNDRRAN